MKPNFCQPLSLQSSLLAGDDRLGDAEPLVSVEVLPVALPEPIVLPEPDVVPEPVVLPVPDVLPEPAVLPEPDRLPEPDVLPEPESLPVSDVLPAWTLRYPAEPTPSRTQRRELRPRGRPRRGG